MARLFDLITIQWIDAFGAGIYLLTALTQFDLWWHRRERRAHLWLGLSALGVLAVNLSGQVTRALRPHSDIGPSLLNMLGIAVALVSLFELLQAIRARRSGRIARVLQLLVFVPALLFAFGIPHLQPVLYLLSLGFLMWSMAIALHDGLRGDVEARSIAFGLIALSCALIYDVLSILRQVPRVEGVPVLGFALLYLTAARALGMRYDREYRELVALRADLETRVLQRTTELEQANRQLDQLSRTDALTGLPNRRGFLESAAQLIALQQRAPMAFSVLMIDVDHFKRINDEFGHDGGDTALRMVALGLRRGLRQQDVVARWGGEEFIALLPDTDGHGAQQAAELLRRTLADLQIDHGAQPIRVTASVGIAEHQPEQRLEATINAADRALYKAKQGGRNRVEIA